MKSVVHLSVVRTREKTAEYGQQLCSSRSVASFAGKAIWKKGDALTEEVWVILLNSSMRVVGISMVARGGMAECPVAPRDVFIPVLVAGAHNVILVHNHPSGDPAPSVEDRLLTARMVEAGRLLGIKVMDHVVWARKKYYSFRDDMKME